MNLKYSKSHSQCRQDLVALALHGYDRPGFFLEAGATDGINLSNTYMLEKNGWNGICCEPNPTYLKACRENRKCAVTDKLLWDENNLEKELYCADEYGGVREDFEVESSRLEHRLKAPVVKCWTGTLDSILSLYQAPPNITYISLDTEGSELRILNAFPFGKWDVQMWSIEHNSGVRDDGDDYYNAIRDLMASNGYTCFRGGFDMFAFKSFHLPHKL